MPLHPMLVHFPIAFWLLGSLVLLAALLRRRDGWWELGWFLLGAATVMAIPAVLAGQDDYEALAHLQNSLLERHRDLGNLLPWPMGILVLLYLHGRFSKNGRGVPKPVLLIGVLVVAGLMVFAAHLGGQSVFLEGMGVNPMDMQKK